jgi:hypothetical protein
MTFRTGETVGDYETLRLQGAQSASYSPFLVPLSLKFIAK